MHTTCIPHAYHVDSTCIPRVNHAHTTCIPCPYRVQTMPTPRAYHVCIACIPNTYHVHTDVHTPYIHDTHPMHTPCTPHAHHMHTTCTPHAHHMHTTCPPHAHHMHTTCTPHAHRMHTACTPPRPTSTSDHLAEGPRRFLKIEFFCMSNSVFEREICEIDKKYVFLSILLFSLAGPVETLKSTKIRMFVDFKDLPFKNGTAHTKKSVFKHHRGPSTRWPLLDLSLIHISEPTRPY